MRARAYLDVCGVLLGRLEVGLSVYHLANHGLSFLRFMVTEFEIVWATTLCRDGDARRVVSYVAEHAPEDQRDETVSLARAVRPSRFNVWKTEIFRATVDRACIWRR